jgi:hypothetical protein
MKIAAWIKRRLRQWLIEDEDNGKILECLVTTKNKTETIRFLIIGSKGMYLIGVAQNGMLNQRMLPVEVSTNQERWWRIWKSFNKNADIRWEE